MKTILFPALNDSMLVLSKKRAEELDAARKCPKCGRYPCACKPDAGGLPPDPDPGSGNVGSGGRPKPVVGSEARHYYGTIELDPLDPVMKMSDVLENVISLFTAKPGVSVKVKLDIEASSPAAFDKNTVIRPVTENSRTLGFTSSEFSE